MMGRKIQLILVCLIAISSLQSQAQALYGTTGLLHAPTAEMQRDKTFMAGGMCCILFRCNISVVMR